MSKPPLKDVADHLAGKGRYGDTMLMHVNPKEVEFMASLSPTGTLTVNPDTGQPEAFLPMLAPLLGGIAGSFLGPALGASAVLGGAIGSGLGSYAATGDIGKGIMSGLLGYGIGSAGELLAGAGGLGGAAGEVAAQTSAGLAGMTPAAAEAATGAALTGAAEAGGTAAALNAATPNAATAVAANPSLVQAPAAKLGGLEMWSKAAENVSPESLKYTFVDNAMKTTLPIGLGIAGNFLMDGQGGSEAAQPQPQFNGDLNARLRRRYMGPGSPDPQGREQQYFQYFQDGGTVKRPRANLAPKGIKPREWEQMTKEYDERREVDRYDATSPNPYIRRPDAVLRFAEGGRAISGPGGGLDDAIPAVIDKATPAALSSGEYVIPAHAVSALGNGSTEEGVRQLDGMVDRTMMKKFGTKNRKPKPLNPRKVMKV